MGLSCEPAFTTMQSPYRNALFVHQRHTPEVCSISIPNSLKLGNNSNIHQQWNTEILVYTMHTDISENKLTTSKCKNLDNSQKHN